MLYLYLLTDFFKFPKLVLKNKLYLYWLIEVGSHLHIYKFTEKRSTFSFNSVHEISPNILICKKVYTLDNPLQKLVRLFKWSYTIFSRETTDFYKKNTDEHYSTRNSDIALPKILNFREKILDGLLSKMVRLHPYCPNWVHHFFYRTCVYLLENQRETVNP